MHERLDVEPEGRTDTHNVLSVEFLEDRRLSGVVEATGRQLSIWARGIS